MTHLQQLLCDDRRSLCYDQSSEKRNTTITRSILKAPWCREHVELTLGLLLLCDTTGVLLELLSRMNYWTKWANSVNFRWNILGGGKRRFFVWFSIAQRLCSLTEARFISSEHERDGSTAGLWVSSWVFLQTGINNTNLTDDRITHFKLEENTFPPRRTHFQQDAAQRPFRGLDVRALQGGCWNKPVEVNAD